MKIDNWPLDRIMRLPDWCFGRRWWVGSYMGSPTGVVEYRMCEENLPDKFVIWRFMSCCRCAAPVNPMRLTIRLGDHQPEDMADAMAMDRLFKGISTPGIAYEFYLSQWDLTWMDCERMLVESSGRKLCFVTNGDQVTEYEMTVAVLISSMPKEVPDWIVSGLDKSPF